MRAFNHVAGGVVFTGVFCSFSDINIFENLNSIVSVIVFSQLADIDHTKSIIGKALFPISKWLQINYGHRTITHSLLALIIVYVAMFTIDFFFKTELKSIATVAYFSHIVFDMCTRQGVPFFYPFSKRPCVLPANPNMRLQVNDNRSEAIVFTIFLTLNITLFPLFASGFWTKYNRFFMTYDHLSREMKIKPGAYEIEVIEEGNKKKGIVESLNTTNAIILSNNDFLKIDVRRSKLINYKKLRGKLTKKIIYAKHIKIDSLNSLIDYSNAIKLTIQSNVDFKYYVGMVLSKSKLLEMQHQKTKIYEAVINQDSININREILQLQKQLEIENYNYSQEIYNNKITELKRQIIKPKSSIQQKKNEIIEGQIRLIQEPKKPNLKMCDLRLKLLELQKPEEQFFEVQILDFRYKP